MNTLIKVEQAFRNIVQSEKLIVAVVKFIHADVGALQLVKESLAQPRTDVKQSEKTR